MQGWIKVSISALFLAIGVGIAFYVGICTFESMAELTWKMVFDAPSGSQLRHFVLIGIVILCSLFLILLTLHLAFRLFETLAIAEEDEKRRKAKLEEEKIKAESRQPTKSYLNRGTQAAEESNNSGNSSDSTGSSTTASNDGSGDAPSA